MTDQEKLEQVRVRISDLGAMLADVATAKHPLVSRLFSRLWAIREIIIAEGPSHENYRHARNRQGR
jgi:hypothetical protein